MAALEPFNRPLLLGRLEHAVVLLIGKGGINLWMGRWVLEATCLLSILSSD